MFRLDHDFSDKWRFFGSYRIYKIEAPSSDQVDIGGILPGDKLGVPASASSNPANPRYIVTGLTGTLTPHLVNEFHVSYLLNSWGWVRQGVTDALSSVPAGLEFSDSHFGCMCPLNMNTQQSRKRIWNGHDWNYNDTLSWVKGKHYFQFGGSVVHWWDHHVRDDQVVAGLPELVYQLTKGGTHMASTWRPSDLPSNRNGLWDTAYGQTLGILGTSAQLFVRGGSDFHLTGAKEFSDTSIEVSLLSPSEELDASDERALLRQLQPGVDGVTIAFRGRRATFLPQVWRALPEPEEFLAALKQKAELPRHFWSPKLNVTRYRVTQWREHEPWMKERL